jgi:hypothetical protein
VTRRWLALACWVGFIAAALAGLHRLGNSFPLGMIVDPASPFEPTLAAALRLAGLAIGYWLAVSTMLYLIGRTARLAGAVRVLGWGPIGPVRRLIDRIVAGALVATIGLPTGVGALPARAEQMTGPGYVPVPAGDPPTPWVTTPPTLDESVSPGSPLPGPLFPPVPGPQAHDSQADTSSGTGPDLAPRDRPTEVVVRLGDDMWKLAKQRLSAVRGREVSDTELAPYWLKVVATNLATIKSGDPDLIFPGEILLLPAVDP